MHFYTSRQCSWHVLKVDNHNITPESRFNMIRAQPQSKSWGSKNVFSSKGGRRAGGGAGPNWYAKNFVSSYPIIFVIVVTNQKCKKCTGFRSETNLGNVRGTCWKSTTILHRKAGSTWWFVHWRLSYMVVPATSYTSNGPLQNGLP